MNLSRRHFNLSIPAALSTAWASTRVSAAPCSVAELPLATGMQALARAYPDFIAAANEQELRWKDGTRTPARLFPETRTLSEKLRDPDLAAQVMQSYPKGHCAPPMPPHADPGRIRYQPFFTKMYGQTPAEVQRNLTPVRWPSRRADATISVTSRNGAAARLERVAEELSALPAALHRFFDNPAGGYYWRTIAGSSRLSGHAFGIAVDINVNLSDYWRNEIPGVDGEPPNWQPKRQPKPIPFEIVDIFERHGFIWGGKWYHYDTMHFEYRPEFLLT